MSAGLRGSDRPLVELHDIALVDLDGVVYKGHEPVPHAASSLTRAREGGLALQFVTNNASREPETVAEQLTSLGIATRPDEVFTAAQAGAALLTTRLAPGARVLVVGGAGLHTAVRAAGYVVVESATDRPDAVIQGFAPTLGWADLAEAAYAVAGGAWFVATNLDFSLPTDRGYAPGNGALVGAVQAATGVRPDSAGKPEPTMYRLAVERTGARSPLVVGDRLDTDLAGARAAGYPGLHVLTGVSSARDAVLARPGERPDYLGADLRALTEAHPLPTRAEAWWACRGAGARVVDGALEVRGDGVDAARAACAAAWDAVDRGEALDADTVPALAVGSAREGASDG
ncbi:HAD hydrolase-like protein [Luteimicrobium xylanilyticum]|uniref:Glycerol-1-phosphatase n=1 Tax=Luteimicrobium xylanilyticum TaxID=1133546 RepID=A0A5P9Q9G9_9MICO|nr:HAD-IIA family hydrolase [Luteimicrobium xylanilyticum]QFU98064.1 Glycerol-1-phosphatase [Luteimicrobium xylanilyticum]